jgi:acylpyruvate hydrolase
MLRPQRPPFPFTGLDVLSAHDDKGLGAARCALFMSAWFALKEEIVVKLVVFGPFKRLGALLEDGRIVDLNLAYAHYLADKGVSRAQAHAEADVPADLLGFIEEGTPAIGAADHAIAYALKKQGDLVSGPGSVRLWPPLPDPGSKIAAAGHNYAGSAAAREARKENRPVTPADVEHVHQLAREGKVPIVGFWKVPRTVIGPDEPMVYPSQTKRLNYEVELAVVFGKSGRNIAPDQVEDHIYGYTAFNDWTIEDETEKLHDVNWHLSKSFDCAASMGPCIVTKDEIRDPLDLIMEAKLNGRLTQRFSSGDMLRTFADEIALVSRDLTFNPGDVFSSGSEGKIILDPPRVGDVVEIWVEGIGTIRNPIVAEGSGRT